MRKQKKRREFSVTFKAKHKMNEFEFVDSWRK